METTAGGTKKFTKAEKLAILKEASQTPVKEVLAKYGLYPGTYYYWKKKYDVYGADGMEHGLAKDKQALLRKLEKENTALKVLLAEKELESKLKDDLLKKKYPSMRKLR